MGFHVFGNIRMHKNRILARRVININGKPIVIGDVQQIIGVCAERHVCELVLHLLLHVAFIIRHRYL